MSGYISFTPTLAQVNIAGNPENTQLPPQLQENFEQAFKEIASTPEGLALIERATSVSPDGVVNISAGEVLAAVAILPNDIIINPEHDMMRYRDASNDSIFHDISIQRLVYHELQHIAEQHEFSFESEVEAIERTNEFMTKYYNEPPRDSNNADPKSIDSQGTSEWDINPNFDHTKAEHEKNNTLLQENGQPILDGNGESINIGRDINDVSSIAIDPNLFKTSTSGDININTSLSDVELKETSTLTREFTSQVAANEPDIQAPSTEIQPTLNPQASYSFG